ncbi:phage major capsid protein [Ensifer sp. Root954]|uniref:phage major capsid protein n=1 Tax=Ensifer sp. Root954 TaxID=1736611 RepID=UPI0007160927|nr:phage major capsid protein [Ensifer sp. Root954]KRD56988.1 hypothetical protein ASE71_10575 [Ensifer sp. Root954]
MTKHIRMPLAPLAALLASSAPAALRSMPRAEGDVSAVLHQIGAEVGRINKDLRNRIDTQEQTIEQLRTRQLDLEQRGGGRRGGSSNPLSWGATVTQSTEYQTFVANSCKGKAKIGVSNALTSISTSAGALITPDRDPNGVMLPRRRLTVRALLGSGRTGSNSVEYFKEKTFVNNAAPAGEGTQKAESDITYELADTPVRTIAHWIPASRQAMEDAPQLGTLVDGSLRYGLAIKEEVQLLYGDGTGQNLHGMIPQATDFDITRVVARDTRLDILRHAISQAEEADLPASGVLLNTRDWLNMMGMKDDEGRYLSDGPWQGGPGTVWGLPVVWTNSMHVGDFLVGAFESATMIYDRMDPEVMVSDEDRDNFIKNMLTIRAEERLAFAVKRAAALIHGNFTAITIPPVTP